MINGFSEQHLCTLPQVADSMSAGVPIDGISIEDGTDTSTDLVNLSNDSMSTRGESVHRPCNVVGHPAVHLRCTNGSEARRGIKIQVGQSSSDRWKVHPRNLYCIAYESLTDGHS